MARVLRVGDSRASKSKTPGIVLEKLADESPQQNVDVGIQVALKDLSSEPGSKGSLDLTTQIEEGKLSVAGALGVIPPHFDGKVGLDQFALTSVLPVVPEPAVEIVRGGVARADLAVLFDLREESGGEAPPVDARISGDLGLAGLQVAADDPQEFDFRWEDLAISIEAIEVQGGVPATSDGKPPIRVARIDLVAPVFKGMRLEDGGFALPEQIGGETEAVEREEVADEVAERIAEGEAAADSEMPAMHLGKLRLTKGAVRLTDRSVTPVVKPG